MITEEFCGDAANYLSAFFKLLPQHEKMVCGLCKQFKSISRTRFHGFARQSRARYLRFRFLFRAVFSPVFDSRTASFKAAAACLLGIMYIAESA